MKDASSAAAWRGAWLNGATAPSRLDYALLALLALVLVARALTATQVDFLPYQDMGSYRKMAEDLSAYLTAAPHHAQRILPPLAVWLLHQAAGLSIDGGFRLVSAAGYVLAHLLLFVFMRRSGLSPLLSLVTAFTAALSQWPVDYATRNIWQASDAWTYAIAIAIVLTASQGRVKTVIAWTLAGVFVRQNLPILGVLALVHLAVAGRDARPLAGIGLIVLAFLGNSLFAGGGAGDTLSQHLIGNLVHLRNIPELAADMRLPLLALPFAPLLLTPDGLALLRRHWWVLAFSLATVGQALLVAEVGGVDNTQRLVMPALWILFPLAGLAASTLLKAPPLQLLYALTPLTFLLSRLVLTGEALQAWHMHRLLPGAYLLLLVLIGLVWRRRGIGGAAP